MSCALTNGRTNPCRNNIGGIKKVYFFKYKKVNYTVIDSVLDFPEEEIFLFEQNGAIFNENITNDENGIFYSQSLSINLINQNYGNLSYTLDLLKKIDLRCIIEFYDGSLRMLGLENGLRVNDASIRSGGKKSDFNGIELTLVGRELISAPYLDSLFSPDFLLLEDLQFLLLENSEKILLE